MGDPEQVQISHIGGRYLVFDNHHISVLRRRDGICGVLVGTVPQSPTQNVFLGVPVELRPEDANILVNAGLATVRDEARVQLAILQDPGSPLRRQYLNSIKLKRQAVERAMQGQMETRLSVAEINKVPAKGASQNASLAIRGVELHQPSEQISPSGTSNVIARTTSCSVSPASVGSIPSTLSYTDPTPTRCSPLYRHLHREGFFMTPGLRFGAHFSVYPGDPLRYHAHFLANDYKWDDEIPLLELVGAGRLSTAVKKGFLAGGEESSCSHLDTLVRVFCVEWAGM